MTSRPLDKQVEELSKGINKTFKSIFPIEDGTEKSTLEFISYKLEKPKFDVIECRQRSLTYSASLKANLRLVVYDIDQKIIRSKYYQQKNKKSLLVNCP